MSLVPIRSQNLDFSSRYESLPIETSSARIQYDKIHSPAHQFDGQMKYHNESALHSHRGQSTNSDFYDKRVRIDSIGAKLQQNEEILSNFNCQIENKAAQRPNHQSQFSTDLYSTSLNNRSTNDRYGGARSPGMSMNSDQNRVQKDRYDSQPAQDLKKSDERPIKPAININAASHEDRPIQPQMAYKSNDRNIRKNMSLDVPNNSVTRPQKMVKK